ncbi:nuclear transport factor 2 family protein [Novosphingobium sp. JCM 18896]|uniref:nuclear transport factor 2 family protein n=1 Tax=Novosphingobium sp. JCM 18896 TaxID=2989731 RepID=UPI0022230C30|nr:nuclear transport factor 2 family protein [Novosphingobium sp. JCM 18896]MCW1427809.1 nuclear transport factor 2 family protein [Novosphingobium sp. JCM 18896]
MGTPTDLDAELRDLIARRDIKRALMAYMRGQDRLDPELQLTAFHDDADVDCGLLRGTGREFTDFAQDFLVNMEGSQHLIGQIDIEVDGDRAHGEVYFLAWHRLVEDGERYDLIMAGRYVDEYACRQGRWAIAKRRELIDWGRKDKSSDGFMADMPLLHLAGRRGADFSQSRTW